MLELTPLFPVMLTTPEWREIEPARNLTTQLMGAEETPVLDAESLRVTALAILAEMLPAELGEMNMMFLDMPNLPIESAPLVVAQATAQQMASAKLNGVVGVCKVIPSYLTREGEESTKTAENQLAPGFYALERINEIAKRGEKPDPDSAQVSVLEAPTHGNLDDDYFYHPERNYIGKDRVVFLVELGGYRVKVVHYIQVLSTGTGNTSPELLCPNHKLYWKISSGADMSNSKVYGFAVATNVLSSAGNITLEVADIPGAVLAQTTGTGTNATITLDTNAAGYNWFIDTTPADNAEFLPTSNPNEWVAKADSEAAGKMDMLSVLLHEYGHALGIEHSANSNDYMSATLQPGTRRLPSADELALMAQLVGEIKPALSLSNGTAQGSTPNTPINPNLPIGTTLSALLVGRLRRTDYGSWSPVFDSMQIPAPAPQFEIAANPKLQNPDFDNPVLSSVEGGTDWTTEGAVAFESGAATLTETAATQTRLSQVFVLGEHDRFLSFTIANGLQANGGTGGSGFGPSDAFEVALLDANTGHSLMGTTGLTHNDAILNLQANGAEHKASGITRIDNADGSRTYLVDLAGIAAGTTVNLAFDLIGFGLGAEASNSQITVRDLRLGVPQTADDSATLAEDTPTVIDALTNDLNARQPGFAPVVVSGPAHGQVEVNADGSFSFTPEQDWNGQDSFTYKLSDGRVDSNLATVTLTVTPVNDAPVAADAAVNLAEDTPYMIDLLALAGDIDSSTLAATIVSGPTHGRRT